MRVVLVRLSALGDVVHTWPLAEAIRAAHPDCNLSWVVEKPLAQLVEGHPALNSVIPVATRRWRSNPLSAQTRAETAELKARFRELRPDLCIDAQGVLKSALVSRWTGAPRKVGLARPWRREAIPGLFYSETITGSTDQRHVVATNLQMVRAVGGTPASEVVPPDGSWLYEKMRDLPLERCWSSPYAVLLPGAGHPSKILPVTTLAEVARGLVEHDMDVVVAWGPGEQGRAKAVAAFAGRRVHLAPPTGLGELTALLGDAALVIGGDTGPVHLAASLGAATLGAFLTTDWRRNGPLGTRVAVVSATADEHRGPSGSARARPVRSLAAGELLDAARSLAQATITSAER